MSDWGKVAIGVRLSRFEPGFLTSYLRLLSSGLREGDGLLNPAVSLPHSVACNYLVMEFMKSTHDSLLMVDDDMMIPVDALEILRRSPTTYDMVSGLYCTRHAQFPPILLRKDSIGKYYNIPAPVPVTGMVEVNGCGLGFLLIKRATLKKVVEHKNTQEIFGWSMAMGEDGQFCQDVEAAGCNIGVNCDVILDHAITAYATLDKATGQSRISLADFGIGSKTQISTKE